MSWYLSHRRKAFQGGTFTYYSTVFDGSTTYLTRGSDLTGSADNKVGLVSLWSKFDTTAGCAFVNNTSNGILIRRNSTDFNVICENTAGTQILNMSTTGNDLPSGSWIHCMASWDLTDTGKRHLYIDDVSTLDSVSVYTDDTIDYTRSDWSVAAFTGGSSIVDGLLSEVYFTNEYLDLSDSGNRAKFISGGKPVDLGSDGSTPTGTSPLIYQNNPYDSFESNSGTGGGFTENGTLADGGADIP